MSHNFTLHPGVSGGIGTLKTAALNSFEAVAREWYAKNQNKWTPNHGEKILRRFERDIFPWVGGCPIIEVNAHYLLSVMQRIEGYRSTRRAIQCQNL